MPQPFNWYDISDDQEKPKKPDLNDWRYYAWAGENQLLAKRRGMALEPSYITSAEAMRLRDYGASYQEEPNAYAPARSRRVGGQVDEETPGESFARSVGSVTEAMVDRPYGGMFSGLVRTGPEWLQDFTRAAVTGIPQTVADIGGSIADWVTGNTGKNQDYTLASNRPQMYRNPGGVAQTIGSFAPDIALAIGTFGGTAAASTAAAGSKIPMLARLGRLAVGAEEAAPTAIKLAGRAITPAATRLERVAATVAGAVPTATNVLPEVTAGRMSPVEGLLSTGMGALGGTFAAGQWGGSKVKNLLSDMAVNMATQAGAEAVTMLPGGAEFDAAQAWKNMLYGAGLGAAFGVMNAAPLRGPGERVTLGSKPAPEMPTATAEGQARFTGGVAKPVDIARGAEELLFGSSAIPETAQPQEVGAFMEQMRQRPVSEMVTLRPDETGAIRSVSDAYLTGRSQEAFPGVPESSLAEAANVERKAYASSLAAEFADNPEALVKVLDLEVAPGEITPENAQAVLASKIENEWLVQAANGKGVAAVENILTQAGLRGAAQTPGPQAAGQPALPAAPVPAQLGPATAPELPASARPMSVTPADLPPVIAGELPPAQAPEYPAGTRPMAITPENMPPRIAGELPARTPEAVAEDVRQQVEQVKQDFGPEVVDQAQSARTVADLTDSPIEEIVAPGTPVHEAAKALENIENTAREELAAAAPVQEATPEVAAPVEDVPKQKRKRIVREKALTEAELPVVEALADATPDGPLVSGTAVASTDVRDAAANRAGQKIAEWAETVRLNPGEELRGRRRAAQDAMNNVALMFKPDGASIKLFPERLGGKVSAEEDLLAAMSDMKVPEFRQAIKNGQTDFAGGAIKIEQAPPYSARAAQQWEGVNPNAKIDQKFIESLKAKYKMAVVGPEGRTFKVKPYDQGGFFIESDNGGGIVLARKPKGPSLVDVEGNKPRVFKTEEEARAYMSAKKLPEDTGAPLLPEGDAAKAADMAADVLEKAARQSTEPKELTKILKSAEGLPRENRIADEVRRNRNVSDATFDVAINNPALRAMATDDYAQSAVDERARAQGGITTKSDNYRVTFPEKNILRIVRDAFDATRNDIPMDVKQTIAERRASKSKADLIYGTTKEIEAEFARQSDIRNLNQYKGLPDMAMEPPSMMGRGDEADGMDAEMLFDARGAEGVEKDLLRGKLTNTLDRSAKYFYDFLEKSGLNKDIGATIKDAKLTVMSNLAPYDWTNVGKIGVENQMSTIKAKRMEDALNELLVRDEKIKAGAGREATAVVKGRKGAITKEGGSRITTPFDELQELGSQTPEKFWQGRYDAYVPPFLKAQENAVMIARKAGIEDPADVWQYLTMQAEGPRPKSRSKVNNEMLKDFDDAKATEIGGKIDKVMNKDADVFFALDEMKTYIANAKGAQAFRDILDVNLLGSPKKPNMSARNLPIMRAGALLPVLYAVDQYVVGGIEDDETYMGIPGKTLKQFLGNGETTSYAMAGLFGVAVKGTSKAGQAPGYRARMGDTMRRAVDANLRFAGDNRSLAAMKPEVQSGLADDFMARDYPTIKPGTPEYESLKAQKLQAEQYAKVSGGKITDAFNKIRSSTTKNTVGVVAQYFSDINNLGARSQFVKDYIVQPYVQMQSKVRLLMQTVEDPLNRILPSMVKSYGKDTDFWDAFWATDYRMSGIQLGEDVLTPDAVRVARTEVMDGIKKEYFGDAETPADIKRWGDFNALQRSIDSLRKEHFRALVGKSLGINSWELETHYGELKIRKDATAETYGAAKEAQLTMEAQLKDLTAQYNQILSTQGKEAADNFMPGFKQQRKEMLGDISNSKSNVRQMGAELSRINKRMAKIEEIDALVQKSIENKYLFRTRDGKAPFVLRLEFDKDTALPSVRREYNSRAEAELGQAEYLREAVTKKISTMPGYLDYIAKKSTLQTELETLTNSSEFTPQNDARIVEINKELDQLDGYKPVSDMTDAEIFRFAQTYDMLGQQKTIRDMRGKLSARRGSNTAKLIVDQIMASTGPVRGKILSGTIDPEAVTPRYIKDKGNSALADASNGDVMMFSGEDAPTVNDLIDSIAKLVDEPIDRTQLGDLIEKQYTYREPTTGPTGKKVDTIWIDMAALRQTVEAYLDPAVPNLSRRYNWVGYYDPDAKWTATEKMNYTVQSLETMTAQIKNYNQWVSLRNMVGDAMDWLNKWDINNGLREYIAGMTMYNEPRFNDHIIQTLSEYESGISRIVSIGTLATNVGSALGNRIQGAAMTTANFMQNAATKYGVRKTNADGTQGEIQWLPSESAASAFVAKKQLDGESSWRTVEGFKWQGMVNPRNYGIGIAAMIAPGTALKMLAKADGYEVSPRSQQGYWALVYDATRRANLTQGGVQGSYAIREGIKTGTVGQTLSEWAGWLTQKVETTNNYGSVLTSATSAEGKFGLTNTDWRTLNAGQRNSVIDDALFQHRETRAASAEARKLLEGQIAELRAKMETQTDKEQLATQQIIDQKLARLDKVKTDTDLLVDQLTDYMVFNRGYEQGNWDSISKARFERYILSLPGGRLAMTMTAPILRAMNGWQGMFRRAGATEGGTVAKLGRAAAPIMGAGILSVLLGGAANTAAVPGGIFLSDMANLAEYLYGLVNEEENEKLDKVAGRQFWEKMAADLGPKYGIPSKEASNFVRATWSEGMIRYYGNININAGNGFFDLTMGGTPAQVVVSYGKGISRAAGDVVNAMGGAGSAYDFMWNIATAMPTSGKRIGQAALQIGSGQGSIKLDREGNPIIDPFTGRPQYQSGWDLTKQTFLGKPWSDTRSIMTAREGGTPLYTPQDKVAWANHLIKQVPYVNFGEEKKTAAIFERDAEELQRAITLKTREYKTAVEVGKNYINDMYNNNERIGFPDGTTRSFREILAETAMSGIVPESELKGKGAESMRNRLLQLADQWGRSRAAAEAVNDYYGGNIPIKVTDKYLGEDAAYKFALRKLGQMYSQSAGQGRQRRQMRERLGP